MRPIAIVGSVRKIVVRGVISPTLAAPNLLNVWCDGPLQGLWLGWRMLLAIFPRQICVCVLRIVFFLANLSLLVCFLLLDACTFALLPYGFGGYNTFDFGYVCGCCVSLVLSFSLLTTLSLIAFTEQAEFRCMIQLLHMQVPAPSLLYCPQPLLPCAA